MDLSGVIIKGIGGYYYVKIDGDIYECRARGVFRNNKITPLVGDSVDIIIIDEDKKKGNIQNILPRKNEFIRPQVSNVDNVLIVVSATRPQVDFMLLDKLLILYQIEGVKPFICVNKIDELKNEQDNITDVYRKSGYTVINVSGKKGNGISELKEKIKDKTTVFTGQSGVGKSTIINKLMKRNFFETGDLSEKISRGKNTTRHTELVELPDGGYILDSPGFSSLNIDKIKCCDIEQYYPEFLPYIGGCKFVGCSHIKEIGCEIKNALEQNKIDKERYERYVKIFTKNRT